MAKKQQKQKGGVSTHRSLKELEDVVLEDIKVLKTSKEAEDVQKLELVVDILDFIYVLDDLNNNVGNNATTRAQTKYRLTNEQLISTSSNCMYTFLQHLTHDNRLLGEYFLKFQVSNSTRSDVDKLLIDNIYGYVLTKILQCNSFSKYINCFMGFVTNDNVFDMDRIINRKDLGFIRDSERVRRVPVNVQQKLEGYESLTEFVRSCTNLSDNEAFFKWFLDLYNDLSNIGQKHGFVHNDCHLGNIMYNVNEGCKMIDFGRTYLLWDTITLSDKEVTEMKNVIVKSGERLPMKPFAFKELMKTEYEKEYSFVSPSTYSYMYDLSTMVMNILYEMNVEDLCRFCLDTGIVVQFQDSKKDSILTSPLHVIRYRIVEIRESEDPVYDRLKRRLPIMMGLYWFVGYATMFGYALKKRFKIARDKDIYLYRINFQRMILEGVQYTYFHYMNEDVINGKEDKKMEKVFIVLGNSQLKFGFGKKPDEDYEQLQQTEDILRVLYKNVLNINSLISGKSALLTKSPTATEVRLRTKTMTKEDQHKLLMRLKNALRLNDDNIVAKIVSLAVLLEEAKSVLVNVESYAVSETLVNALKSKVKAIDTDMNSLYRAVDVLEVMRSSYDPISSSVQQSIENLGKLSQNTEKTNTFSTRGVVGNLSKLLQETKAAYHDIINGVVTSVIEKMNTIVMKNYGFYIDRIIKQIATSIADRIRAPQQHVRGGRSGNDNTGKNNTPIPFFVDNSKTMKEMLNNIDNSQKQSSVPQYEGRDDYILYIEHVLRERTDLPPKNPFNSWPPAVRKVGIDIEKDDDIHVLEGGRRSLRRRCG